MNKLLQLYYVPYLCLSLHLTQLLISNMPALQWRFIAEGGWFLLNYGLTGSACKFNLKKLWHRLLAKEYQTKAYYQKLLMIRTCDTDIYIIVECWAKFVTSLLWLLYSKTTKKNLLLLCCIVVFYGLSFILRQQITIRQLVPLYISVLFFAQHILRFRPDDLLPWCLYSISFMTLVSYDPVVACSSSVYFFVYTLNVKRNMTESLTFETEWTQETASRFSGSSTIFFFVCNLQLRGVKMGAHAFKFTMHWLFCNGWLLFTGCCC